MLGSWGENECFFIDMNKCIVIALGVDYDKTSSKEKRVKAAKLLHIYSKEIILIMKIGDIELKVPVLVSRENSEAISGRKRRVIGGVPHKIFHKK